MQLALAIILLFTVCALAVVVWLMRDMVRYLITLVRAVQERVRGRRYE